MPASSQIYNLAKAVAVGLASYGLFRIYKNYKSTEFLSSEAFALKKMREGKALIRIIRTGTKSIDNGNGEVNSWDEQLKQLGNYEYRPSLRTTNANVTVGTQYKYVHLTGEIIQSRSVEEKAERKKSKKFTHTKKMPLTYISRHLHTDIFFASRQMSKLTGLIFDKDQCIIKGMFAEDINSDQKEWYSSERQKLTAYKNFMESSLRTWSGKTVPTISYRTFAEFQEMVDNQDPPATHMYANCYNEVLAKLSLNALCGIVIARDTPEARQIAIQRQADIKQKLGKDLPIIFYNPHGYTESERIRIYKKAEQEQDQLLIPPEIRKNTWF